MSTKHTPGPFKAERNYHGTGCYVMQPEQNRVLALVNEREAGIEHEECAANANLFAAAPDLLEACRAFVTAWEKCLQLEKTDVALGLAKAAIAKSEGK